MNVYCADARDLLRSLSSESVDLIVTDPPYRGISGGTGETPNHRRPGGMLIENNGRYFPVNDIGFDEYMADLYRVLRDPAHMYLMTNVLNLETALVECRRAGFGIHNLLVARKQNATPNRWYMKNAEYVIFARKGRAFSITNKGDMTCHDWTNPVGRKTHPTEKSVELMERYILNSSRPGDLVLDPFMGTGATGIAAIRNGRRFIGAEIDPTYFIRACARMGTMPSRLEVANAQ